MRLSLTNLRSGTHELRHAIECGEMVELTFHGRVIGRVNPVDEEKITFDHGVVNAYFGRRKGEDSYAAIEKLKQARTGREIK